MTHKSTIESTREPNGTTLVDLFFSRVAMDPNHTFCRFKSPNSSWSTVSFKTAGEKITSLAAGLHHLGFKRGRLSLNSRPFVPADLLLGLNPTPHQTILFTASTIRGYGDWRLRPRR